MSVTKTPHDRARDRARHAEKRTARIEAGLCVDCGELRAPLDPLFCAAHRQRYRDRCRKHRQADLRRYVTGHRVEHTAPTVTDSRPLVVCLVCCDLPHQRPLGGCPKCHQPWRALANYRASDTAEAREYSRCP